MYRTVFSTFLLGAALISCPAPLPFAALSLANFQVPEAERDNCMTFDVQLFEGDTLRYSTPEIDLFRGSNGKLGAAFGMDSLKPKVSVATDVALITLIRARCTAQNGMIRSAVKPFPQPYTQSTQTPNFMYAELNP